MTTTPQPGSTENLRMHATAIVHPTDMPGLFNVQVTTGERFYDLTIGQVQYLAAKNGWTILPAKPEDWNPNASKEDDMNAGVIDHNALIGEFDARKWAATFAATVRENPSIATDEETLHTWFAASIMAGYDHALGEVGPR